MKILGNLNSNTQGNNVKAPPMVGPTWTRVHFVLGSDCSPTLFQGTILPLSPPLCFFVVCTCMSDDLGLYQYVVSLFPTRLCSPGGYTCDHTYVHLHGSLYPMMDYTLRVYYELFTPMTDGVPWGFLTILLLLVTVLGLRYFSYWYDNIG